MPTLSGSDFPVHSFQPLSHSLVFDQPRLLSDIDSWHEHIPFAFFTIAALRPRILVELGTWKGDSYCAFCQAVQTLDLQTRCYAVDTWKGDRHTGAYGREVIEELRAYHDPLYGSSFSRLLEQSFDEAATHFTTGSIDLLHVDGCHTYDAVSHDVETWLPKLSERGVVLLHDTNVREGAFGVWRLWDELLSRYPGFAFSHGHGLGVLAIGSRVDPNFLDFLETANREPLTSRFFSTLGSRIAVPARERRARELAVDAATQARELAMDAATQARAELDASRTERERLQVERDRIEAELRAREADLANLVQSLSWRVTAPLRKAKHDVRQLRDVGQRYRPPFFRPNRGSSAGAGTGSSGSALEGWERLAIRPLISIITPVYNTDPAWLERAVESVRSQTYPHWQLCLADDGSTNQRTHEYLHTLAADPSIETLLGADNRGIAAASNRALEVAEGEFVAFLDHDDELAKDALLECVQLLNDKPQTDAIYTDEDKIDQRGVHSEPFFKPDWSPEFFRGVMYVGHLLVLRRALVESIGGFDSTFDGVQDYELMLRASENTDRIEHVPGILYHWRKLPQSVASSPDAKEGISDLQTAAVNSHLKRGGIPASACANPAFPHRVMLHPKPRASWPRVTVIVPTKDAPIHLARCLESIFARSTYPNFSVLLVDNGTTDPDARQLFDEYPVDVLPFDGQFNFSRVNNLGVERAGGDFVVFLNNDAEVQTPNWLEAMVHLAERDEVGAVGPLLLYPNGTVQHAGVVLGLRSTADHVMRGFPGTADGYAGSLSCTREVSAVTAACMVIPRRLFTEVGGFDEHFATHYQDVELCLRIRRSGRRILYTPRAVLRHYEGATRGTHYDHLDRALLLDAWGETIAGGDPYYNPSLSLSGADDYRPCATAA